MKINLNADIAEGFGAYDIGNDAELMTIIRSANVACGFHAGDANSMHRLVTLAKTEAVSIGVHSGFNDLWGFGRRKIDMDPKDLELMVAYQIGALKAMARYAGLAVTHLKPHGALNNMAAVREDYALAIGRAIQVVDAELIYVALTGSEMEKAARKLGLKLAREGFADRQYEQDGNLTPRSIPGSVYEDPAVALAQCLAMVRDGHVVSRQGSRVAVAAETICVHGDEPTAVALARHVRQGLEAAGCRIVTIPEMLN
ncbi:5-oxoprolinase subunit PxpA [Phreatobacter stygius]|uniref:5-oxoprolinase subunit A n=2 Tax=Phreatobacter stygius TaxID=1940610 RepID=A0A4D7BIX0_9HYPH|nr:5-oxoprolinase subunit PxpA [Phreatobacter stygius]QCI68976.1 5-oxoprolinase subunit PxpA [Phreatobacter stygius]